jgi:uncharacterized membrane protein YqjE
MGSARFGLIASLQRTGASLLGLLHARVELLGSELREEQARIVAVAAWGILALLLLQTGALFLGLLAVAAWGEERRLLALTVVAALLIGAGGMSLWLALRHWRREDGLFAASLAELERDRRALRDDDDQP